MRQNSSRYMDSGIWRGLLSTIGGSRDAHRPAGFNDLVCSATLGGLPILLLAGRRAAMTSSAAEITTGAVEFAGERDAELHPRGVRRLVCAHGLGGAYQAEVGSSRCRG